MQDFPPEVSKAAPGIIGAAVSAMWTKEHPVRAFLLFLAGSASAIIAGDWLSHSLGIPPSLSGFLVGVYGIAILNKGYEALQEIPLGQLLSGWVQSKLNPKE
jgi:hypothetical protein